MRPPKIRLPGPASDRVHDAGGAGLEVKVLEETRNLAQAELAVLEVREEHVEKLKKDRDALLESWSGILPEALQDLTGEERNRIYRMLRP